MYACIPGAFAGSAASFNAERNWRRSVSPRLALTGAAIDDLLDASDNSVVEHHLDAMRMVRRLRENPLHHAFSEGARALVLLFHDAHLHSRPDVRSRLPVHSEILPF